MLLIRRRPGQSIRIGDDIEIRITEVTPAKVTLAIAAPRDVAVTRAEVQLTSQQNLAAAGGPDMDSLAKLASALRVR